MAANYAISPPRSTQIPDEILDYWLAHVTGAEFKVLMYIARRTFGFRKPFDAISLSQIAHGIVRHDGVRLDHGTNLHRETILRAIATLERLGLVGVQRRKTSAGDFDSNRYHLVLADERDRGTVPLPPREPPSAPGDSEFAPEVVASNDYPPIITPPEVVAPAGQGSPDQPATCSRETRPRVAGSSGRQHTVVQQTVSIARAPTSPAQATTASTPVASPERDRSSAPDAETTRRASAPRSDAHVAALVALYCDGRRPGRPLERELRRASADLADAGVAPERLRALRSAIHDAFPRYAHVPPYVLAKYAYLLPAAPIVAMSPEPEPPVEAADPAVARGYLEEIRRKMAGFAGAHRVPVVGTAKESDPEISSAVIRRRRELARKDALKQAGTWRGPAFAAGGAT